MKDFKYIAFGITNQCKDDHLIPFFDYDDINISTVRMELDFLQKVFDLSNIYIMESTNGYNAFSFDKLTFDILKSIYNKSKYIDKDFIKYGLQRGFMTLRLGNDKKLVDILKTNNRIYLKSSSHKKFFNDIMRFHIVDLINFDNEKIITITMFPSNKHGFEMECFKNATTKL